MERITSDIGTPVRNGKVLSLRGSYTWPELTGHARGDGDARKLLFLKNHIWAMRGKDQQLMDANNSKSCWVRCALPHERTSSHP